MFSTEKPTVPAPTVWTRAQYMRREVSHELYYGQFVTPATIGTVKIAFPAGRLSQALSQDRNLNNISLDQWDDICWRPVDPNGKRYQSKGAYGRFTSILPFDRAKVRAAGESVTRNVLVCIAKEAARQIVRKAR